jgi:carbon monoxide dehydrogenase subunit G
MKVGSFLGVKLEVTNEITALEPNRELRIKGISGPRGASMEATMRFEAVGEGTRLNFTTQIETGGLFKMAGPLLASQTKKTIGSRSAAAQGTVGGAGLSEID